MTGSDPETLYGIGVGQDAGQDADQSTRSERAHRLGDFGAGLCLLSVCSLCSFCLGSFSRHLDCGTAVSVCCCLHSMSASSLLSFMFAEGVYECDECG